MADGGQSEVVSQLLEEESVEEEHFRLSHQNSTHLKPGVSVGLVHSPTTDTLDSVYLDAPISDSELTESSEVRLDEKAETSIEEKDEETPPGPEDKISDTVKYQGDSEKADGTEVNFEDKTHEVCDINLDGISLNLDREELDDSEIKPGTEIKEDSQPSLTKYFGSATTDAMSDDDFFSMLPPMDSEQAETAREATQTHANRDDIDELLDLIIDDTQVRDKTEAETKEETSVSRLSQHEPQPDAESVLFEMIEDVEDKAPPVEIEEEKEQFESFTADLADEETMDALGMSPAPTSYMTERNIKDYFHQNSQAESLRSLGLERQMSSSSGTSVKTGLSQEPTYFPSSLEEHHSIPHDTVSETPSQKSQPPTPAHKAQTGDEDKSLTSVDGQKASVLQASAAASSVDTPSHLPSLRQRKDSQNLESGTLDKICLLSYVGTCILAVLG